MALERKAAHFKLRFAVSSVRTCTGFLSALPLTFPSLALAFLTTRLFSQFLNWGQENLRYSRLLNCPELEHFLGLGSGVISLSLLAISLLGCVLKSEKISEVRLRNHGTLFSWSFKESLLHRTHVELHLLRWRQVSSPPTQQYSRKNQYPLWLPGNLLCVLRWLIPGAGWSWTIRKILA